MKSLSQKFVEFPDTIKVGITAVVVWVFGWAFAQLVALVPFLAFLGEYVPGIAAGAAAAIIAFLQDKLPDQYGDIAIQFIKLILMVLAAFGIGNGLAAQFGWHALALFSL